MKNTNRVRNDDGGSAPAPQSQSNYPKAAITLFDYEADNNITQQNLSHREFVALKRSAQKVGMTLRQFIKTVIASAVQSSEEIHPAKTIETKKRSGRTGNQSGQCDEYAGPSIVSGYWLKLGFSREELHALHKIAELFENKRSRTAGRAALLVLSTALMHWEKLEPFVFADQQYAEAEGFLCREVFVAQTVAKKFNLKIQVDKRGRVWRKKN
jgi:hypothetical protein